MHRSEECGYRLSHRLYLARVFLRLQEISILLFLIAYCLRERAHGETVSFTSEPSGAVVVVQDGQNEKRCTTPCSLRFPDYYFDKDGGAFATDKRLSAPLVAEFSREGYTSKRINLAEEASHLWHADSKGKPPTDILNCPGCTPGTNRIEIKYFFIQNNRIPTAHLESFFDVSLDALSRSNYTEALEALRHATRNREDAPRYARAAQDLSRAGRNEDAVELLGIATRLDPHEASWRLLLGNLYLRLNNSTQAEHEFQRLVEDSPQYPDAWAALGSLQEKLGEESEAIASYEKLLALSPASAEGRDALGALYFVRAKSRMKQRQFENAAGDFALASTYASRLTAEAGRFEVEAYQDSGAFDKARQSSRNTVTKILHRHPSTATDYATLGQCYIVTGQYNNALEAFQEALKLRERPTVEDYVDLAWVHNTLEQFRDALSVALKAVGQGLSDPGIYAAQCRAYLGLKQDLDSDPAKQAVATDACTKASQMQPGEIESSYFLAIISKDSTRANRLFEAVSRQSVTPKHADYDYYLRGNAQRNLGHYQVAATEYLQSLRINPQFLAAAFNLSLVYATDHKCAAAQRVLEEVKLESPQEGSDLASKLQSLCP
jgi:tetratricopeptide (TPR) repeat protein